MDNAKLRSWWFVRQGLDGSLTGQAPREVLLRSGWARSVAGANPYLTIFSRSGSSREGIDQSVADLQIHELPCARGCTYVVPADEYSLALAAGIPASESGDIRTAKRHLGVTEEEIQALCDAVMKVLSDDIPMDPRQITAAIGEAGRSLGPEGKKRGTSSTPPLAFTRLQAQGKIRRVPVNGRLDQQRYGYVKWLNSPSGHGNLSQEEILIELAQRYFRWIGPATLANFQWFSGANQKAAKEAVAAAGLVTLADHHLHPEDLDAWQSFEIPSEPQYALVASMDAMFLHRREISSMVDPEDLHRKVQGESALFEIGSLAELTNHAILDRGRLIGLWEFDPDRGEIVFETFVPMNSSLKEAISKTEKIARDQLGDVRCFSLDSPASRKPKIDALRAAMQN